jgi:hypothetical protein
MVLVDSSHPDNGPDSLPRCLKRYRGARELHGVLASSRLYGSKPGRDRHRRLARPGTGDTSARRYAAGRTHPQLCRRVDPNLPDPISQRIGVFRKSCRPTLLRLSSTAPSESPRKRVITSTWDEPQHRH